jgi:hypothetical protein
MRALCLAVAIALSPAPAFAADVPLSPIGLPFSPGAPRPVAPDHPLYHRIMVDAVADMPGVVGVGRVALMTNIASAMRCIDMAAYGQAPQDCALTPGFNYRAPTYKFLFVPAR